MPLSLPARLLLILALLAAPPAFAQLLSFQQMGAVTDQFAHQFVFQPAAEFLD